MASNQILSTNAVKGKKKDKARLTVLLTVNAIGTEVLKPLVINKSKRPHTFARSCTLAAELPVEWYFNKKVWMHHDIFQSYLANLERRLSVLKQKVLLLADNVMSHIVDDEDKYFHVKIYFLPLNTTAHLQPMDAGIIKSFKMQYKKCYLLHIIK